MLLINRNNIESLKLYFEKYKKIIILGKGPTFKIPEEQDNDTFIICINDTINFLTQYDMLVVNDIETWNRLFMKVRHALVAPCVLLKVITDNEKNNYQEFHLSRPIDKLPYLHKNIPAESPSIAVVKRNRNTSPHVIITFTTCKRLDLFQQTVNSILNMWADINMIDYWYCEMIILVKKTVLLWKKITHGSIII